MKKFLMILLALWVAICFPSPAICADGFDFSDDEGLVIDSSLDEATTDKPMSLAETYDLLVALTAEIKTQALKAFPERFNHPSVQLDVDALAQTGSWFDDLRVVVADISKRHAMQEAAAISKETAALLAKFGAMIDDMSAPMAVLTDPDMYKCLRQRYKLFSWWDHRGRDTVAWINNLYDDKAGSTFQDAIRRAGASLLATNKENQLDGFNTWAVEQIKLPNFFSQARVSINDRDVMTVELKLSANTMSSLRNVRDYYKETKRLESSHQSQHDAIKKALSGMNEAAKKHLSSERLPIPQLQKAWENISDVMNRISSFYYDHWEGYIKPFAGDYATLIEEFEDGDFYSDPMSFVRKEFTGSRKFWIMGPTGVGSRADIEFEVTIRILN